MTKLTHLVVDAGALIKCTDLSQVAENLWTTSDVLAEIKDSKARRFVARLPVELKTRDPSEKDMEAVVAFSRLTGDFSFLSLTDLRIMALTYMFERETNGVEHIRTAPKVSETKVTGPKAPPAKVRCRYLQTPGGCRNGASCPFSHNLNDNAVSQSLPKIDAPCRYFNSETGCSLGDECRFQHVKVQETTDKDVEGKTDEEGEAEEDKAVENSTESAVIPPPAPISSAIRSADVKSRILSAGFNAASNAGAEDDDGKNWVNAANQAEYSHSPFGSNKEVQAIDSTIQVGCITTDYSMQNVLLQMGLHLISTDGMVINRVKQWILKCAACFKTTTELTRQFCPVCGNHTLERISCSLDKDTEQLTLYTRANRPMKLRGSKFSLPMPTGGRNGDLLLREDQLMHGIWAQRQKSSAKVLKSAFGEHVAHDLGVKAEKQTSITVGYGRMNPNAQKGRERRGKKKRNTD
ncbi:Nin1 binding protein [Aphanomyces cochlioides]|nr:Nin1 binding protein [Aphanomyces cochlioides]